MLLIAIPAFADPIAGVIDEASATSIKVSGATYQIDRDTTLEDQSGNRVAVRELIPGTRVELELDDTRRLVDVRAFVIR